MPWERVTEIGICKRAAAMIQRVGLILLLLTASAQAADIKVVSDFPGSASFCKCIKVSFFAKEISVTGDSSNGPRACREN